MNDFDDPAVLKKTLDIIYDEAEAALLSADSDVMKKALDNIRALSRYKFDVLADADKTKRSSANSGLDQ